jgi:hypothetical protein
MASICGGKDWTTDDPLGIGGLLSDAYRVAQMMAGGIVQQPNLLAAVLDALRLGLARYTRTTSLKASAQYRLAFRELGLSLGIHALERLQRLMQRKADIFEVEPSLHRQVEILLRYGSLAEIIENFWLVPANRRVRSFAEHADINTVMLATSLVPDAYLTVPLDSASRSMNMKQTHQSSHH